MNDPVAFESSRLLEADFAASLLSDAGIPFYRSMHAGEVRQGMPAAPADFPGNIWSLHVPGDAMVDAQRVLNAMSPLHSEGAGSRRARFGVYAAVVFGPFLLLLLGKCVAQLLR